MQHQDRSTLQILTIMKKHRILYNLAFIISHSSAYAVFGKSTLILSMITLIVSVTQGCSKHPQDGSFTEVSRKASVKLAVHNPQSTRMHSIDALVFNDDQLQRLDCYQNFENMADGEQFIGSCSGAKILLLCANLQWNKDSWREYNSYKKACSLKVDLENEDREFPVMASVNHIKAGEEQTEVTLERISSEVVLRSICCDFTGKPYAGESITDTKVYLTNVNGSCSIIPQDDGAIERIINHRELIESDINIFNDTGLIFRRLEEISSSRSYPGIELLCYPNTSPEESIGSPFTKLVVEGKIQGETWYWPIDINRSGSGIGIERNRRYIFDITIRCKGTKDPDITISSEMTDIIFEAETWKEKESYSISF